MSRRTPEEEEESLGRESFVPKAIPSLHVVHLSPHFVPPTNIFECPTGCGFRRHFATVKGFRQGMIEHFRLHRIQVIFDFAGTSLSELREKYRREAR